VSGSMEGGSWSIGARDGGLRRTGRGAPGGGFLGTNFDSLLGATLLVAGPPRLRWRGPVRRVLRGDGGRVAGGGGGVNFGRYRHYSIGWRRRRKEIDFAQNLIVSIWLICTTRVSLSPSLN